jgi:hypothetical protein
MPTGLRSVNTLTGIQGGCQASTGSEVLVGIGLIQGSNATSVLFAASSTETRASWAPTMAVGQLKTPSAQNFLSVVARLLMNLISPSLVHLTNVSHATVLELSGLNLQVADAARNSGFDTRNHVALLDLIWSVRRVAFNHGVTKPSLPPPPKHPIYPDRYRPGAQGNSSKKSLKRAREAEAQAHGTSSNPIDLDVDNSENENQFLIPTATKRQKTAIGLKARSVTTTAASGAPNPVHPSRFPNSRLNTIKTEGKENIPPPRTTYMPSPRSLNPPPPRDSPSARKLHPLALVPAHSGRQRRLFCPRYPLQTFNQQQETFYELRRVSHTLSDNLDAVNNCQRVMKNLYDADSEIRHHDVFDLLLKLRDDMQDSENGILKALRDVDDVIAFLKSGGRDSAIGMDEIE